MTKNEMGFRGTNACGVLALFALVGCGQAPRAVDERVGVSSEAFSDVSSMTDAEFFGAWNGSAWTTPPKLDYTISGLSTVQADAKAGNYAQAKTDLLAYFRTRNIRQWPGYSAPDATTQFRALLEADDFYFDGGESPLSMIGLTTTPASASTIVTDTVKAASDVGQVSFMLMARTHSTNAATIQSRESATNKPQLIVNLVGGGQRLLTPIKDATIRGGATYGDINYGSDTGLIVKEDAGVVVSDNTRRSYLTFDLSGISATSVASASLSLFGVANSGPFNVVVLSSANTAYQENTITWNNTSGGAYSYTGISGGYDWGLPQGAHDQYAGGLSRFDAAADLLSTYSVATDEYYAGNLIRIWLDFISDKGNLNPLFTTRLDAGARATNWLNAYNTLRASPSLDAAANTAILKQFSMLGDGLAQALSGHRETSTNWGMYISRGLYQLGLYFPELISSSSYKTQAKVDLDIVMGNLVQADGSFIEADTAYAVGSAEDARSIKALGTTNGDTFTPIFDDRVQRLGQYIMDFSRPDGTEPAIGDADPVEVASEDLSLAASYPNRTDLLYFGSSGTQGTVPGHTSSLYPLGKSAFMKTGYSASDLYMSIDLNDGTHGHPDLNAVTLFAYGRELLVDPGRGSYDPGTASNFLRLKTLSHNTIEIDGAAQATSTSSPQNVPRSVDAWSTNAAFDFWEGDHGAYAGFDHFRDVFFSRTSKLWIVSDYVTAPAGSHTYKQTWHFLPNANVSLSASSAKVSSALAGAPNIQVVPADPASISASLDDGWYSSRMFSIAQAKYASYVKSGSGNQTFDTVLFPTQAADTTRDVEVTRLTNSPSAPTTVATALKVELDRGHNGNVGYYLLSHEAAPATTRSFGNLNANVANFNFNGKMAYVEMNATGSAYLSAAVAGGTRLRDAAAIMISSPSNIKDLEVQWLSGGGLLDIEGSSLIPDTSATTAVKIYAPAATTVTLNGAQVPFTRSGDFIYAARAVNGFAPTDDAYVRGGVNANANSAVETGLQVKRDAGMDNERRAYLKFDFSSYAASVTSAKLRVYLQNVAADASRTVKVYATTDFSENTLAFNNAPAAGNLLGSWTIANTDQNKWLELDVSSYVAAVAGKQVMFYLVNQGTSSSSNGVTFASKDNPAGVNRPLLVVN